MQMKRQYNESEKARNNAEGLLCFKLEKTDIFSDLITEILSKISNGKAI